MLLLLLSLLHRIFFSILLVFTRNKATELQSSRLYRVKMTRQTMSMNKIKIEEDALVMMKILKIIERSNKLKHSQSKHDWFIHLRKLHFLFCRFSISFSFFVRIAFILAFNQNARLYCLEMKYSRREMLPFI